MHFLIPRGGKKNKKEKPTNQPNKNPKQKKPVINLLGNHLQAFHKVKDPKMDIVENSGISDFILSLSF